MALALRESLNQTIKLVLQKVLGRRKGPKENDQQKCGLESEFLS